MALFVDTSALVKAYIAEPRGSEAMRGVFSRPEFEAGIFISETVAIETYACFARKLRNREIADDDFRIACAELRQDMDGGALGLVEHSSHLADDAAQLLVRHADRSVGGIDCLHIVAAEWLSYNLPARQRPVIFVAADRGLLELARLRGFPVFDPEADSLGELVTLQFSIDLG